MYGILGVAMPLFWGGLVLVYVFYFKLGIAPPPTGRIDMLVSPPKHLTGSYLLDSLLTGDMEALVSSAAHLVLPVITLAFVTGASIARMTYTSMRRVLASQFIVVGITQSTTNISWAILNAAGLSFLGVGLQPPTPEWGVMISEGSPFIVSGQWWMSFFPGAALILMTTGFILVGDGLSARTER